MSRATNQPGGRQNRYLGGSGRHNDHTCQGVPLTPECHDTARLLMERFPGWKIWPGTATRTWWAMGPNRLRLTSLLEALTAEELAAQITQADPAAPHRPPTACAGGPTTMATPSRRLDTHQYPVRLARRFLDDALTGWNAEQWSSSGRIVVSELVTNAERHGQPPIFLALALETG